MILQDTKRRITTSMSLRERAQRVKRSISENYPDYDDGTKEAITGKLLSDLAQMQLKKRDDYFLGVLNGYVSYYSKLERVLEHFSDEGNMKRMMPAHLGNSSLGKVIDSVEAVNGFEEGIDAGLLMPNYRNPLIRSSRIMWSARWGVGLGMTAAVLYAFGKGYDGSVWQNIQGAILAASGIVYGWSIPSDSLADKTDASASQISRAARNADSFVLRELKPAYTAYSKTEMHEIAPGIKAREVEELRQASYSLG